MKEAEGSGGRTSSGCFWAMCVLISARVCCCLGVKLGLMLILAI